MVRDTFVILVGLSFSVCSFAAPVGESIAQPKVTRKPPTGRLVTASAGEVLDEHLTARQVLISSLLEDLLYRNRPESLSLSQIDRPAFARETSTILLETAIWLESKGFPVAAIDESEIATKRRQLKSALKLSAANSTWQGLKVSENELAQALRQKLAAKKLMQFKVETASLPVSEEEAKDYFKKNRLKYDQLPFENFRESIKTFLAEKQVKERLQEWFDVLKVKYRINNHLAGRPL